MIKIFSFVATLLLLLVVTNTASANHNDEHQAPQVPERNGDYADPEHPGVRVRVFVHEPKNARVTETTSPVLVCTDPQSLAVTGPTGWKLPTGSWTYQLNVNSAPSSVGGSNFQTLANSAFNTWQGVQSRVTFTRGADTSINRKALDFKNIVTWGRTSGSALAVTYTWYYTATNIVADVDTIMNQKFAWRWTNPSLNSCSLYDDKYDAQDILTHELGHWMGLNDHYSADYQDNTMFGYGSTGELKKNTLTTGDINGTIAIYP